jgi:hypothetical protein
MIFAAISYPLAFRASGKLARLPLHVGTCNMATFPQALLFDILGDLFMRKLHVSHSRSSVAKLLSNINVVFSFDSYSSQFLLVMTETRSEF